MSMVYALLLSMILMSVILLIMSIVNAFVLGYRRYFLQIKVLFGFKVDKSFYKSSIIRCSYGKSSYQSDEKYYFFINIKSDTQVILFRTMEGFSSYPTVHYINKIDNEWKYEEFKITNNSCIFTQIIKEIMCKKMSNHTADATLLEEDGDLNTFINNHLIQLVRDKKLNTLLK